MIPINNTKKKGVSKILPLEEAVEEFKQVYFDEVGIRLSDQEATKKATGLLNLFEVLTGRDTEGDNED